MRASAPEPVFAVLTDCVRGERGRHHVLAEAVVVERRAVALALNCLARAEEIDPIVFRSSDLRQHAPGLDVEDLYAALAMIDFAAGESRACKSPQSLDVEAQEGSDRHAAALLLARWSRARGPTLAARVTGGDSPMRNDSTEAKARRTTRAARRAA